jgi:hypothetical protein
MNPDKMPAPQLNPEHTPIDYVQPVEYGLSPEQIIQREQAAEHEKIMKSVDRGPAPPPALPMPMSAVQVVPMPAPTKPVDNNPVLAADDDLIEKAWVEQVKKVVADNRNDPYKLAKEVSQLQSDYLHKRYGREIGVST